MGDPAGVGPAITLGAHRRLRDGGAPFFVIATEAAIGGAGASPRDWALVSTPSEAAAVFPDRLPVLRLDGEPVTPGAPDPRHAPAIIASIRRAVEFVRTGAASAVVTNPIAKSVLYAAGFPHPGHTEFLGELAGPGAGSPVMMLAGGGLKVALVTIHLPLKDVPGALSVEAVFRTGQVLAGALKRDFSLPSPRIGVCGLNPHAGESGSLGREEIDVVTPACRLLRDSGVHASDPRPGDVVFHEAREGRFDAVLAMYHDQGLIPVKTLDLWGGVNITLGLPFIRTSPDHGTAFDAAGSGSARCDSLVAALNLARDMAQARSRST